MAASLMLVSIAASAKTLEVTVSDIRNDKGNILVMAKVAGQEQPAYGMAAAKAGKVIVTLEGSDYKLKMGDRGPAEGYATRKCKLPAEHNTATLKLYYPATENE